MILYLKFTDGIMYKMSVKDFTPVKTQLYTWICVIKHQFYSLI